MIVLVDIDGPVANLLDEWLRLYNIDYDDNLVPGQIKTWDMTPYVKEFCGHKIYDYLDGEIYDGVNPVPGAFDGVKKLRDMGHRVVFVTSSPEGTGDAKYTWLKRNGLLGDYKLSDNYVEAHDKSIVRGDILVDDRIENVSNFPGETILWDAPYNRDVTHRFRAKNWGDVVGYVGSLVSYLESNKIRDTKAHTVIHGVGTDAPVAVSDNGAKQSALPYRFDLVDPTVLFSLANILAEGSAKYGEWNWRGIGVGDNLNHALTHIYAYLAGDKQDDHLGHAFCRLMFAKSVAENSDPLGLMIPNRK